jgi:hypothetical protein
LEHMILDFSKLTFSLEAMQISDKTFLINYQSDLRIPSLREQKYVVCKEQLGDPRSSSWHFDWFPLL